MARPRGVLGPHRRHAVPGGRAASATREIEQLAGLVALGSGQRVLDLCCGVGRHAIELSRRGLRVTEVDRTRASIDRAGRAAQVEGVDVELVVAEFDRSADQGSSKWR